MSIIEHYRSEDGGYLFTFKFVQRGGHLDIYCLVHPPLNGRDPDPHKTHLFSDGQVCIASGMEPRSQGRAEELAKMWAEYFLQYRGSGIAQY